MLVFYAMLVVCALIGFVGFRHDSVGARLLAAVLSLVAFGVLALIAGQVAWFVSSRRKREPNKDSTS
jgi:hypothetical protein